METSNVIVPPSLDWMRADAAGREWLAELPDRVNRCARRWGLDLEAPYAAGGASWVAPGTRAGQPVVLKIQFPHRESEHEAEALDAWDGRGAVRLFDHDVDDAALLMEQCNTGQHLSTEHPSRAVDVLCELLPQLWIPAGNRFRSLEEEAQFWIADLHRELKRTSDPEHEFVIHEALRIIETTPARQHDPVLVHQDLHADNVILRGSEWVAIDPKPLVGEREFAVAPIVRSSELGHSQHQVVTRLETLVDRLGLDRERARQWTIVQTVAWGTWFTDPVYAKKHADVARWLIDAA